MNNPDRQELIAIARQHDFEPAQRLPPLPTPQWPNFIPQIEMNNVNTQARELLADLRKSNDWKDPTRSKLSLLRSKKKKESLADINNWTFTGNEKAVALDHAIQQVLTKPWDPSTNHPQLPIAQALLDNEDTFVLARSWTEPTIRSKALSRSKSINGGETVREFSSWLQIASEEGHLDLIELLASREARRRAGNDPAYIGDFQLALDEALGKSLFKHPSHDVPKELLAYGADPNNHSRHFSQAVNNGDMELVKLFLQARKPLHPAHVSDALLVAVNRQNKQMITLLLAYGAGCTSETLQRAIASRDIGCTAAVLSLNERGVDSESLHEAVVNILREVDKDRLNFLRMLLSAGAPQNTRELQGELIRAVENDDSELVDLLITYRTSPDTEEGRAVCRAVSKISLPILDNILQGHISEANASRAVASIPSNASEAQTASIVKALIGKRPSAAALGSCLARSLRNEWEGLVTYLVAQGANTDVAIQEAIERGSLGFLDTLFGDNPSQTSLDLAFTQARLAKIPDRHRQIIFRKVCGAGYSGIQLDQALIEAVKAANVEALKILLDASVTPAAINEAFGAALVNDIVPKLPRGLQTVELLLQKGQVDIEIINSALFKTVDSYQPPSRREFSALLLQFGADVNWNRAAVIKTALASVDRDLCKELIRAGADRNVVVPNLIEYAADEVKWAEEILIHKLRFCFEHFGYPPSQLDGSVLFLAMSKYPESNQLVELLLIQGWEADTSIRYKVSEHTEAEPVSSVLWAICQSQVRISDSVIVTLLDAGVASHSISPESKLTPLIAAADIGRVEIVRDLVQRGAKATFRDKQGRSALYFASQNGHEEIVRYLLQQGAASNDGSLHAAAKRCDPNAVQLLLNAEYDPNELFQGKTPLAELCSNCQPRGDEWEEDLRETVRLLLYQGSDPAIKLRLEGGKTALHLAIHNQSCPTHVLAALLACPQVCQWIPTERNRAEELLFKDRRDHYYSPTKYIEYLGPESAPKQELIRLLLEKNCEDMYYSLKGAQPLGYCGLPARVQETQDRVELANYELQEQLRRKQEIAQRDMDISRQRHQRELDLERDKEKAQREREARDRAAEQSRHNTDMQRQRERNVEDLKALQERQRLELQHDGTQGRQRKAIKDAERSSELSHNNALIQQNRRAQEENAAMQRRLLGEQEQAAARNHDRQVHLITMQNDSVRVRANEMKAVAQAAQRANIDQRLLTDGTVD